MNPPDSRPFDLISLGEDGERSLMFFRQESADLQFEPDAVDETYFAEGRILHIGSNVLIEPPAVQATYLALDYAAQHGCVVSCDPNLRLHVWPSPAMARSVIETLLEETHILKLSEEELHFLADGASAGDFWREELAPEQTLLFALTRGDRGAELFCGETHVRVDAPTVDVVDTTGAGDAFTAGLLTALVEATTFDDAATPLEALEATLDGLQPAQFRDILHVACAAGAAACCEFGATPGLPGRGDLPTLDFATK